MGRISKEELYAIKKVPTLGDTVIGTDAQNKDITVQFPVEAFGEGGDGSTIFNNNRFKKVEIGDAVTPSEVATLINNITPTVEVLADEVVLFSSLRPPQKEGEISSLQLWALQGVGKGTYGVGGTITVLDSQPFIIDSGLTVGVFNPGDVINSELVDLGDFSSSTNLVDIKNDLISTINGSSSTYVIESGTNWYFEGNVVGRGRVLYGWQGPNGTYGNGGSLANSNDLFLIIDEGSQEIEGPTGLENITEGGKQGWRLKFRDPQNYGDIGEGAIDFSKSTQPSSTNGATGEGSIAYGVDVKAPGFGSFVSGGNSEISGTFNSGFGEFLISNGYGSLITGFDNIENSQFGYNFTSGTGNRLGLSGGIGSGVLLQQGGGLATAVFGAANEEITYNAVGDYDRQPMIIVGNGTHTTPSGSSWVAIKRSNLLVGLRNGELILPSTSIARIDAELTGRQITTKEWVLSKISSGSVGGGIPDAPVDGESYVRKDGAWVPLDISATGIQSITAGTPNVSITDGGVGEKIISVTQTTAGLLSNVYFTAETITTSEGTFYKTLINDKGSVPDTLTPNSVVLDDNEVGAFSSEFIGDPSPIENPITEGVYAAFPVIEVDSNQANQRIKIEVYICDNEGVPLDGGGEVGTLGSPTIVIADSGIVDIQAGNPTSVNCQGFIDFTQNPSTPTKILFGQRFRYVILAEKVGASGGQVTFTLFSGSDYNSYYQIPTVGISTGLDPNAIHKNISNEFSTITEVTEPNNDSFLIIEDELGAKKKVKVGSLGGGVPTLQQVITEGNSSTLPVIIDNKNTTPTQFFGSALFTVESLMDVNGTSVGAALDHYRNPTADSSGSDIYATFNRLVSDSDFRDGRLQAFYSQAKYGGTAGLDTSMYGGRLESVFEGSGGMGSGTGSVDGFLIGVRSYTANKATDNSNINYIRAYDSEAVMDSTNGTIDYLQGHHNNVTLIKGTVNNDVSINYLDFDYTSGTVNGDLAYITTKDTGIDFSFVSGTARFIDSLVSLPSRFSGSIESTALIVTGKTSDDVLLGDGSTTSLASIGGGYQNITESIDVNNDFDITIGDTNTAAIKVQNQNSFNYIEIGDLGLASRVDVPSTDIRLGDQFGFLNGVNMLIGGTQIELNTSNGFVLSTNFGTEKVTLKNDLLSSNVQYDVNFPDKANGSSETFAMLSDTKSKLVENLSVSGTYDIDYSFDTWNLVVTGDTTFTESNLPTSGTNTKAITLIVTGEFAITFPAGWTTNIVGDYDGAVRNNIVVEFIKTGDYTVQITQPD